MVKGKERSWKNYEFSLFWLLMCQLFFKRIFDCWRLFSNFQCVFIVLSGGQNSERRNVERPIFGNSKIANIKITKDEFFDNFILNI